MTINSVSLQSQAQQTLQTTTQQQTQLALLEQQISSGYVSNNFAGLGSNAQTSIDLRASSAKIDTYSQVNTTVSANLTSMATVMTNISTMASSLNTAMVNAQNDPSGTAATDLQTTAKSIIQELNSALNTQVNGSYIFSGTATGTAPMSASGSASALAAVTSALSGYTDGTASTAYTNAASYMSGNVSSYYAGNSTALSAKIDDGVTAQYGITANNPAILQVLQAAYVAAGTTYSSSNATGYQSIISSAQSTLATGQAGVNQLSDQIGTNQELLASVASTQSDTQTTLASQLSNVEDVNVAAATTQLQNLQAQLETSYKVISMLSTLSLVNYM